MAVKSTEKSTLQEFPSSVDFLEAVEGKDLPQVVVLAATEPLEFEIIADHYRDRFAKGIDPYQVLVYVAESEDMSLVFQELFTPDMFHPNKLILLKNGSLFFKPMFDKKNEETDFFKVFQQHMKSLSETVLLLVHYDQSDIPAKLNRLFPKGTVVIKSKNLYTNQTKDALHKAKRLEGVSFSIEAEDEFLHKIPPNLGAYLRAIQKLKLYLHKKHFDDKDIENVLLNRNELQPKDLVEYFFENRRVEFFREFQKFQESAKDLLIFLTIFLRKTDEIRRFKVLRNRYKQDMPEDTLKKILGWEGYSDKRVAFQSKRLIQESNRIKDKTIEEIYNFLLEANRKSKSTLDKHEFRLYFSEQMVRLFRILEQ